MIEYGFGRGGIMRTIFALLAGLALSGMLTVPMAAAKEQVFTAEDDGQISFVMPSGNIGCIYTPEGGTPTYEPVDGGPELSCDRIEPSYVNITLGPKGKAVLIKDPGEQGCCGGDNVFAYGNKTHLGDLTCTSSSAGLVCETSDKKHGLCLSRTRTLHY
ncbi:MAG: hypothetical protein ABIQ30_15920 [Devosia sp.]